MENDQLSERYFNIVVRVVGSIAVAYGMYHLGYGKFVLGLVDLLVGLFVLGLFIGRKRVAIPLRRWFLSLLMLVFLSFLYFDGATGNVGYVWMFAYPVVTFYLNGQREGSWWVFMLWLITVSLNFLAVFSILRLPYGSVVMMQVSVAYLVIASLAAYAEIDRKSKVMAIGSLTAQLSFVVRNSPIIVFMISKEGVFTLSDGAGLTLLGLKPGEVIGKNVFEFYKDRTDIIEAVKKTMRGNEQNITLKFDTTWFQARFSPVLGQEGVVDGILGLAIDVTSDYITNEALQQKVADLENLNRLMVGRELKMAELKRKLELVDVGEKRA